MYDKLAKSLRICGDSVDAIDECCFEECIQHERPIDPMCMQALCNKAADAIEELTAVAESYKRSMEAWADTAGKAVEQMPRWVSVADRLPEPEGHHEYIVCVKHSNPELKAVFVTTAEFEARVIECGVEPFWDGYEDGIIRVTHWMPFPEPPQEEA